MPRRSLRNLLRQFRQLGVDVRGAGATVSDQIQLSYQLDNMSPVRIDPSVGYLGIGFFVLGFANQFATLELEVRNPGGILIDSFHVGSVGGINVSGQIFTTGTQLTMSNLLANPVPEIRQGTALLGFATGIRCGTTAVADTPDFAYRFSSPSPATGQTDSFEGMLVQGPSNGVNQFIYCQMGNASDVGVVGARWRELGDPEGPPI